MPHDSIRDDDPDVQRLLRAVEALPLTRDFLRRGGARTLTGHLVEAVLAERARTRALAAATVWGGLAQ